MRPADAIRSARLRAGLTQHALASRAGTSQATVSAYESGRKQPSVATLDRLLRATGSRLAVAPARAGGLKTEQELERAGRRLTAVLELADSLPVKHRPRLEYPRLPSPGPSRRSSPRPSRSERSTWSARPTW